MGPGYVPTVLPTVESCGLFTYGVFTKSLRSRCVGSAMPCANHSAFRGIARLALVLVQVPFLPGGATGSDPFRYKSAVLKLPGRVSAHLGVCVILLCAPHIGHFWR